MRLTKLYNGLDNNFVGKFICNCNEYCYYNCLYSSCGCMERVIQKLAEYENLEEQGLLINLPCKVGDVVYYLGYTTCKHGETMPDSFGCCGCYDECDMEDAVFSKQMYSVDHILREWKNFRDGWYFLNEEEALRALNEK